MQWKDIEKKSQDEVQPMIILYNKFKHINVDTVILFTNISIQTQIQFKCSFRITPAQELYITNFPRQTRLRERIV